jgi:LmbE family N-acetylglucosaminyl deacetylase
MANEEKMKVLVIGAHPSDPFPACSGTVIHHVNRGDEVILMTLTYGEEVHTEHHLGKSRDELRKTLLENGEKAASVLGVNDYRFLDFGDTPLIATRENMLELGEAIQDIRPEIIICAHYPFRETHQGFDHGETARMLERAPSWRVHSGKEAHRPKAIWFSAQEQSMKHPVYRTPDTYVDITDVIEQKIEACLQTWNPWACSSDKLKEIGPPYLRDMGMEHGRVVGVKYAESYESPWLKQTTVNYLGT